MVTGYIKAGGLFIYSVSFILVIIFSVYYVSTLNITKEKEIIIISQNIIYFIYSLASFILSKYILMYMFNIRR